MANQFDQLKSKKSKVKRRVEVEQLDMTVVSNLKILWKSVKFNNNV